MENSTYGNLIVLKNTWLSQWGGKQIGIVKCRDFVTDTIKFYIGTVGDCETEWEDICYIIDNGQKLTTTQIDDMKKFFE